jgi:DNA-directed RNA polymerase subunit A'
MAEQRVQHEISGIEFAFFSPKQMKEFSVAKIVTPELYDKEGYPVDGGLMDIRLGVIDPGLVCKTDGQKLKDSLGHFGHIELARPVVHIKFVAMIVDMMKSTCRECGRILIPKNRIDKSIEDLDRTEKESGIVARREMIKGIIASIKTINVCPYCKAKQQKITLEKPSTLLEDEKRISPIEIRTRLERIPDDDLQVFGIDPKSLRPEFAILTVLSIPPVTMRPSITLESGERSEDDLTHKLGDIVRINQRLFENINAGAPEIIVEDLWDLLQYHITTFFDNETAQLPPARHRSGQPLKTLTTRIKSKEGRIRHNLVGKRTNFSARTVISPDPKLKINEVGVPKFIALKLTVPETITDWNKDYVKQFVARGPDVYPGANYVIRPDGKRKRITNETKEQLIEELQPGFIVERHLMDGDLAIFNRQPSLHRMSMMCHKVRVLPGLTLRLHPAVCTPYNADFDGDEMNLHIPQTEEAREESELLMQVETQLISPRYGLSIIGANNDSLSGIYLLTQKNFTLEREEAIDILTAIGVEEFSDLPNKKTLTGREIFSTLLPKDFTFTGYTRTYKEGSSDPDTVVKIKEGNIVTGFMDKANLGEGQGLMLRHIHKNYGPDFALDFLGKVFNLGNEILLRYGFSIATADIDLSPKGQEEIEKLTTQAETDVENLINAYELQTLEILPGRTLRETLEVRILETLNKARSKIGKTVAETAKQETDIMKMIKAGARGNLLQLTQMSACVGQQAYRGGRISRGYHNRTLSCFKKGDLGSASHGFIGRGFKSGLKPHELFFMSMTGRDSMMDTALRTPKSGYLYRRLANALQDLKVEYDFTVRESSGKIVQFNYGEDGIDVSKSEGGRINVKQIIDAVMEEQ